MIGVFRIIFYRMRSFLIRVLFVWYRIQGVFSVDLSKSIRIYLVVLLIMYIGLFFYQDYMKDTSFYQKIHPVCYAVLAGSILHTKSSTARRKTLITLLKRSGVVFNDPDAVLGAKCVKARNQILLTWFREYISSKSDGEWAPSGSPGISICYMMYTCFVVTALTIFDCRASHLVEGIVLAKLNSWLFCLWPFACHPFFTLRYDQVLTTLLCFALYPLTKCAWDLLWRLFDLLFPVYLVRLNRAVLQVIYPPAMHEPMITVINHFGFSVWWRFFEIHNDLSQHELTLFFYSLAQQLLKEDHELCNH